MIFRYVRLMRPLMMSPLTEIDSAWSCGFFMYNWVIKFYDNASCDEDVAT